MPRASKPKRPKTWIEVAVANGGFRKALKALTWAHSWIYVEVALGREPTVDEVAEWWSEPRRTAFREQAAFRECFPTLDSPAPLFDDPEHRARVKQTVDAFADLEASARRTKRPTDLDLLTTGLLNPST